MRDSTTQGVLGTFIATFLYCLIVLRTIRRAEEVAFVPHLSVTLGVLLAVASVGVFIYFIHHVSISIQANAIAMIAGFTHRPEDRTRLLRHAEMIARGAREGLPEDEDRRAVEERCHQRLRSSNGGRRLVVGVQADRG